MTRLCKGKVINHGCYRSWESGSIDELGLKQGTIDPGPGVSHGVVQSNFQGTWSVGPFHLYEWNEV